MSAPAIDARAGQGVDAARGDAVHLETASTPKKKKKKSKGLTARGPTALPKSCGTGFEEYYADPPVAPEEYQDEFDLYHPSLKFEERIETCLQRYRGRRRLDNERTHIFNRYLIIGGIDCQPRQFNTTSGIENTEDLSKNDLRGMMANDTVLRSGDTYSKYYTFSNAARWEVDFAGVAAGFLSVSITALGCSNEKRLVQGAEVVDNFLRYVLMHDVCPEYQEDVARARKVCEQAREQLPLCRESLQKFPGEFNLACVKLFCTESDYMAHADGLDPLDKFPENMDAEVVFHTTVGLQKDLAGRVVVERAKNMASIKVVGTRQVELEISTLIFPTPEIQARYGAVAASFSSGTKVQATGVVIAKHYSIEEGWANQPRPTAEELESRGNEAFFLEEDCLRLLCPGMKLRVVLHDLNCDLSFVSMVKSVYPSYYVFLPQELMVDWKEPRENEREAPSVTNPDAEFEEAQENMEKEQV